MKGFSLVQAQSTNMACSCLEMSASTSFLVTPGSIMTGRIALAHSEVATLRSSVSDVGATGKLYSRFFSAWMAGLPTHSTNCWIGPYVRRRLSCEAVRGQ